MSKSVRTEISARLKSGNLYTLPELKLVLKEFLKRITTDARKDFDQLLFLTDFFRKLSLEKPQSADPILSEREPVPEFEMPEQTPSTDPRQRMRQLLEQLHYAVQHVATAAATQRKERLVVMKDILAQLESTGDMPQQ